MRDGKAWRTALRWALAAGLGISLKAVIPAPSMADPPPDPPAPAEGALGADDAEATAASAAPGTPEAPPNPYQGIIVRNAFNLKDPPPPPPPAPDPSQQAVNPTALKLSAITTLFGDRRAMFVLQEPGKPEIRSDLVREGEQDGSITNLEVIEINAALASVKVRFGGKDLALNFDQNGLKIQPGPAPVAPGAAVVGKPGSVAMAGQPVTTPAVGPHVAVGTGPMAASTGSAINPNASGLRQLPTRPTRLGGDVLTGTGAMGWSGGGAVGAPQSTMTPEQQIIMLKAQEQNARQQGMSFPPIPPVRGLDAPPTPVSGFPPMPGAPPIPGQYNQ